LIKIHPIIKIDVPVINVLLHFRRAHPNVNKVSSHNMGTFLSARSVHLVVSDTTKMLKDLLETRLPIYSERHHRGIHIIVEISNHHQREMLCNGCDVESMFNYRAKYFSVRSILADAKKPAFLPNFTLVTNPVWSVNVFNKVHCFTTYNCMFEPATAK